MRRRALLHVGMAAVLLPAALAPRTVLAERMVTEVITIGFRPLHELIDVLKPLVPPPGTVTGLGNQLVVKTTPANLEEIKAVLASIDRAPANLLISVRHTIDEEVRRDLAAVYANVRGSGVRGSVNRGASRGGGASVSVGGADGKGGVRVDSARTSGSSRDVQRLRVLEGREAFIQSGVDVPTSESYTVVTGHGVTTTQGTRYQGTRSGFYVRPRLAGDTVTLEISPQRETPGRGGTIDTRQVATAVSGPLGRWMEIGGVSETTSRSATGIARSSASSGRSDYGVYVKVERLD